MGTNYYAIPKLDDSEKVKIIKAVLSDQMDELRRLNPQQIHIGKSSAGWPFLFNHNDWEYYKTIGEMVEFLSRCEITDEYGCGITYVDFIAMAEEKQKFNPEEKFSNDRYYILKTGYGFSTSTEFS